MVNNTDQTIKAFWASELIDQNIAGHLRQRGWEVTPFYRFDVFRTVVASLPEKALPDVVLLGGAMDGRNGFSDVLELLRQKRLSDRDWPVVPFSSDPMLNKHMGELGPRLLGDGIRISNILGDSPRQNVFVESKIQALESEIRSGRSGIEGGAGDPRRK